MDEDLPHDDQTSNVTISFSNEVIVNHIDEIKAMRDEINWRVKIAYNSSIVFISALTLIGGSLFAKDNLLLENIGKDEEVRTLSGIGILIAISAWAGVQNANHLIEKRIELYSLDLIKIIQRNTNHAYFGWLGYLYGSVFFRNARKNTLARLFNSSIGFFIYVLPNLVAICVWVLLIIHGRILPHIYLFTFASVVLFIAIGSTFMFLFYVIKVNKECTAYYEKYMKPYFKNRGQIN